MHDLTAPSRSTCHDNNPLTSERTHMPRSGSVGAWVVQGLKQFVVERGVRVEAASPVAGAAAGRIGEPSSGFLNQEDPRCVVPFEVALGEEPIDLASDDFNQWQRARRWAESDRKLTSCRAIKGIDRCAATDEVRLTVRRRSLVLVRGQAVSNAPPPRVDHERRPEPST